MKAIDTGDPLLNTQQVAEILDLEPTTLELWRHHKRYDLAYVKVGRNIRYRRSEVERFIASNTVSR